MEPTTTTIKSNLNSTMMGFQLEQFAKSLQEILPMLVLVGFLVHTGEVYEFIARTVFHRSNSRWSKHVHNVSRRREEELGDDLCLQPTLDFTEASSEDEDDDYLNIIASAKRLRMPLNASDDRKAISKRRDASPNSSKHMESSIFRRAVKQRSRQFASFEMIPEETGSMDGASPASQEDADGETNPSSREDTTEAVSEESGIVSVSGNYTSTNSFDTTAFPLYETQAFSGRRRSVPTAALKSRLARARPPDHLSHAYAVSTSSLRMSYQKLGGSSPSLRPSTLSRGSSQPMLVGSLSRSPLRRGFSLSHLEDSRESLQRRLPSRRNRSFKHKAQDVRLLNRIVQSIHTEQSESSRKSQLPRSLEN